MLSETYSASIVRMTYSGMDAKKVWAGLATSVRNLASVYFLRFVRPPPFFDLV